VRRARGLIVSLIFIGLLTALALAGLLTGTRPVLGLDLEGGVRVVLTAPGDTPKEVMERAANNIRQRVDSIGVAEPDLFVSGTNIEVQIPGTAQGKVEERGGKFCVISSDGKELGCVASRDEAEAALQATGQERLIQLIGTTARLEQREVIKAIPAEDPASAKTKVTCPTEVERLTEECSFEALKDQTVVFADDEGTKYELGPVRVTGDMISKATAVFNTPTQGSSTVGWSIGFDLTGEGSDQFAKVTKELLGKQLAIVVDQDVLSAPTIQSAITGGSGEITGGPEGFAEREAKDLATALNAGALPVNLTKSQVETVSATLGKESLQQGLVAGLVGLVLLALYLAYYYRLLGLVTWVGMAMWATLAFGIISFLGKVAGYSLTLAGVAGLIVALGITADSYIVFYERLKDEVRHGKSPRAAVQPAFRRAWKTIIAADVVTLLAAGVLYLVAISSVRGFALTLGISVLLDMFVVYFYKRPTVFLMARSPRLLTRRRMGMSAEPPPEDEDVAAVPVPAGGGR